jgi:predicted DNA-binding protein
MSSKYTAFRCPEDLLEKAKIRAKRERRSLSNYLITLIDKDVAGMEELAHEEVGASRSQRNGEK